MTISPSENDSESDDIRAHFEDLEDGCGCTELWEYLSERRGEDE